MANIKVPTIDNKSFGYDMSQGQRTPKSAIAAKISKIKEK